MSEQLSLPDEEAAVQKSPLDMDARSSLRSTQRAFEVHMKDQGFTENTIKAFLSDLGILSQFVGPGTAVGAISSRDLNRFTDWLMDERGVPCSPKSLARRVTALKVFFGWLAEEEVLSEDPSAPVVHKPVMTPLPDVLSDSEVERMLQVTRTLRQAERPDARPHLLVTLLLHTGIKKGECVDIAMNHFDLSDSTRPVLWIRYANPRRRHKERKLYLPVWWPSLLTEYRTQYQPDERLFSCTARNLEYILNRVAEQADLANISFSMLRWTCTVRDYRAEMPSDKLRQKLGVSKVTWREKKIKVERLAEMYEGMDG